MLDGDMVKDSCYISTPGSTSGNKSGRMWPEQQQQQHSGQILRQASEVLPGKTSYQGLQIAWERQRGSIMRRS